MSNTNNRFLQEIRVGNKVILPALFQTSVMVVRAIEGNNVSLLPDGSDWDGEPWVMDASLATLYRIVDRNEKQAPFADEIQKICDEINADSEVEMLSLKLLRAMIAEEERELDNKVSSIWSSGSNAKDEYSIDSNLRKCNGAIHSYIDSDSSDPEAMVPAVLFVLRGYMEYKWYLFVKKDKDMYFAKAVADFTKANYSRGLFHCLPKDDHEKRKQCLLDELIRCDQIDKAVLYTYLRFEEGKTSAAWLRYLMEKYETDDLLRKALVYVAGKCSENSLILPDEKELYSEKNVHYLLSKIEEIAPDIPIVMTENKEIEETDPPEDSPEDSPKDDRLPREEKYYGYITAFRDDYSGHIHLDNECNFFDPGYDLFFHIKNVKDDALREALMLHPFTKDRYRVAFYLFHNSYRDYDICAGEIEWLNPEKLPPVQDIPTGYITEYSEWDRNHNICQQGYIRLNGEKVGFDLADIQDSILKFYLMYIWNGYSSSQIPVHFMFKKVGRQRRAIQICRVERELPRNAIDDIRLSLDPVEFAKWEQPRIPKPDANLANKLAEKQHILSQGYFPLHDRWLTPLPKVPQAKGAGVSIVGKTGAEKTSKISAPPTNTKDNSDERTTESTVVPKENPDAPTKPKAFSSYMDGRHDQLIAEFIDLLAENHQSSDNCISELADANHRLIQRNVSDAQLDWLIEKYKSIIRKGNITAASKAVNQLVTTLIRRKLPDHALALLKAVNSGYDHFLPRDKYVSQLITTLGSMREEIYWDEMVDLYLTRAKGWFAKTSKIHDMNQAANLRYKQGRFEECLDILKRCEEIIDSHAFTDSATGNKTRLMCLSLQAECWYKSGNSEEACRIAQRILDIDPNHTIARMIEGGKSASEIDDLFSQMPRNALDPVIEIVDDALGLYAQNMIDGFKLSSQTRLIGQDNLDAEGNFCGNMEKARQVISRLREKGLPRGLDERVKVHLSMAKILYTLSEPKSKIETYYRSGYRPFLARALEAQADVRALNSQIDSAFYLYSLSLGLFDNSNGVDMNYRWALYRGIALLLIGSEKVCQAINSDQIKGADSEVQKQLNEMTYLPEMHLDVIVIRRFIMEALLVHMDSPHLYSSNKILEKFYRNTTLRNEICDYLCEISNSTKSSIISMDRFLQMWNTAVGQIFTEYRLLENSLNDLTICDEIASMESALNDVRRSILLKRLQNLSNIDYGRLISFLNVTEQWIRYLRDRQTNSFAAKRTALGNILNECARQIPEWEQMPLRISYELLLNKMQTLQDLANKEQENLFNHNPASVTIELGSQNATRDGNKIRVQLCVKNAKNTMDAEGIRLEIPNGIGYSVVDSESAMEISYLASGSTDYLMVTLLVEENLLSQGNLAINVLGSYRDASENIRNAQVRQIENTSLLITLYDRNQSQTIANPYDPDKNSCASKMFYGRENAILNILENMSVPGEPSQMIDGKGVVIYGQKRAGKTSIKDHLRAEVMKRFSANQRLVIVDIDSLGLCRVADKGVSFKSMFTQIINNLVDVLYDEYPELGDDFIEKIASFSDQMIGIDTETAQSIFMNCISVLRRRFKQDEPKKPPMRMVLLIDEFTYIYEDMLLGYLEPSCMTFFKAMIENYKMMIIAIAQDSYQSFSNYRDCTNALAVFRPVRVTYLEPRAAQRLVKEPTAFPDGRSRFDDESVQLIQELTAGSAYYIQMVCRSLIEYMNENGIQYVNRGTLEVFLKERFYPVTLNRDKFDPLFKDLQDRVSDPDRPRDNFNLLREIARQFAERNGMGDYVPIDALDFSRLRMDRMRVEKLIDILKNRDVLLADENDCIRIKVVLMREWFLKAGIGEYREG